ncbi:cupin domain-containing protein [Luethyella okanaganae]|uniref:Cupin domain-containing protein n=1 Tax=Luethyella okanaganae TaxID=69372 RepID=A0ABW1VI26_9MICO
MDARRHALIAGDAEALIGVLPVEPGSVRSRRIFAGPGGSAVRLALARGEVLEEHISTVPLLLQVLSGHVAVDVDDERVDLPIGGLLHIDANVPHAVEGLEDAQLLLLLMGERSRHPRTEPATRPPSA